MVIKANEVNSEKEIVLAKKIEKNFRIIPAANPDPLQKQIWTNWSRGAEGEIVNRN
jgi:hypothetical protein